MALVTAPQPTIPDFEHEYHTVIVDTFDQPSSQYSNGINAFLPTPLENVIQVELLAARFKGIGASTELIHVSIDELKNTFFQRAKKDLDVSGHNSINGSFGSIVTTGNTTLTFKNEYPISQQYLTPIRKLDRLNVKLYKQDAVDILATAQVFLVFNFVCKKKNLM